MGLFGCCSKNDVTNEDGTMQVFDTTFKGLSRGFFLETFNLSTSIIEKH